MLRIVITGGGTGGHVFPGIAVAEALLRKARDTEILFVGGARGFEATTVPAAGYRFEAVPARGLLGKRWLGVSVSLWTVLRGTLRAYRVLQAFAPDVVFATGGYVSGPVAAAAWLLNTPIVLHEQNSVPGITNRILSRVAREVHLNLASARKHFPRRHHLRLSGSPLRQGILAGDAARAREELGLERGRTTILVLGGSQGARSINRAAVDAALKLQGREDLQFVLQTGSRDLRWAQQRLVALGPRVAVRAFIERMGDVYQLADLVVARAGAMTLAELAACGKAAILVPYPHATHNHQEANARDLVEAGAAEMILDRELEGGDLGDRIAKLIDTPRKLREMSNNALVMARPDAAEKIAEALLRFGSVALTSATDGESRPPVTQDAGRSPATVIEARRSVTGAADAPTRQRRSRGRRGGRPT